MKGKFTILLLVGLLFLGFGCRKDGDLTVNSKEELEEKLQAQMDKNGLTSISYCVVKNDQILHSSALGFADEDNRRLATDSTRYMIASISKTITGVALMQLVEQNRIALDDDINQFLPFSVRNPSFPNSKITYRMLLSHTSSISDDFQNPLDLYCYGTDCAQSLEQFFADVFTSNGAYNSPLNFSNHEPGTNEDYSNLGAALIGYLVERIEQVPFDVYCKNQIFLPLGMNKTEWRLANCPLNELAIPYSAEITSPNPHYTFPDYPNGGLRTTVRDLSKFLRAMIQNGTLAGTQILSPSSVAAMKSLQFGSSEQCLAFYYDTFNGRRVLGHNGGEMGVSADMYFDTSNNVGVIIFNNDDGSNLENFITLLFNYGDI